MGNEKENSEEKSFGLGYNGAVSYSDDSNLMVFRGINGNVNVSKDSIRELAKIITSIPSPKEQGRAFRESLKIGSRTYTNEELDEIRSRFDFLEGVFEDNDIVLCGILNLRQIFDTMRGFRS